MVSLVYVLHLYSRCSSPVADSSCSSRLYSSCNSIKGILAAVTMNGSVTHWAVTHLAPGKWCAFVYLFSHMYILRTNKPKLSDTSSWQCKLILYRYCILYIYYLYLTVYSISSYCLTLDDRVDIGETWGCFRVIETDTISLFFTNI